VNELPIKVCLISLHDTWHAFAVRILSSVLRKAGHETSIVFFKGTIDKYKLPTSQEIEELLELIKKLDPDLIGIGVTAPIFQIAIEFTRHIKKLGIPVIFGGKHPTICPEDCIEYADMICIGDGEEALVELANKMDMREDITNIRNLWVKKGDEITKNDMRPVLTDLDSLPFLDYSDENKYYIGCKKVTAAERTMYRTMTSRGCPFNCAYCCNHVLSKIYKDKGPYLRRRSVENVIEELIQAKKLFKNLHYIGFTDDLFTFDIAWVERFCTEYRKHINLSFTAIVHPNFVDMKIIHLLKDAGMVRVDIGVQSGSERVRKNIFHRHTPTKQIIEAAKILRKLNIEVSYDFIVENPYEEKEDKRETLSLLVAIRPSILNLFPLTYFSKTDLSERALKEGIISPSNIEGARVADWRIWRKSHAETWQIPMNRNFNIFWNAVYRLTVVDIMPNFAILLLSGSRFLQENPRNMQRLSGFLERVRRGKLDKLIKRITHTPTQFPRIE